MKKAIEEKDWLSIFFITLSACIMYALSGGIRSNYGMMMRSLVPYSGIDYGTFSFIVAAAQFIFGFVQPFFGILALRKGNRWSLVLGLGMVAAGLFLTPFCRNPVLVFITFALIMAAGFGGLSFGIIMSAVSALLPAHIAAVVSGMISASAGMGAIIFAPLVQSLIAGHGIADCMRIIAFIPAIMIPAAFYLTRSVKRDGNPVTEKNIPLFQMFREAFTDRSYRLLLFAFFTCGFHMAIIESHLYTQMITLGISEVAASYFFSLYGIATMTGSVFSGTMDSRFPMKVVAGCEFGARPLIILLFFLLPKSSAVIAGFAMLLGFTGGATVPPVSGLVGKLFGPVRMATLFGCLFVAHQLGSFFSTWIGGITINTTGSYLPIWTMSAVLAAAASLCCFHVKEPVEDIQ